MCARMRACYWISFKNNKHCSQIQKSSKTFHSRKKLFVRISLKLQLTSYWFKIQISIFFPNHRSVNGILGFKHSALYHLSEQSIGADGWTIWLPDGCAYALPEVWVTWFGCCTESILLFPPVCIGIPVGMTKRPGWFQYTNSLVGAILFIFLKQGVKFKIGIIPIL